MSKITAHDKTREGWLRAAVQKLEARLVSVSDRYAPRPAVQTGRDTKTEEET